MPVFSPVSARRLAETDHRIQLVLNEVIKYYDFSVDCGHRGIVEQTEAFASGHSTKQWPESKHNSKPSLAVDIAPWPTNWDNIAEFYYMAGYVMAVATDLGVPLRWGGRWKKLRDLSHFELRESPSRSSA